MPRAICAIEGCEDISRAKGLCWTHYGRLRTLGDPLATLRRFANPLEALEAKTDRNGPIPADRPELGPCWIWTSTTNGKYGKIKRSGRFEFVHRVSYEIHKGPIPAALVIDHLCRNPLCVNPEHLEAVTNRENLNRGIRWPQRADREKQVVAFLSQHPDSTVRDVADFLGHTLGATRALLQRMQAADLLASRLPPAGRPRLYRPMDGTSQKGRAA